MLQCIVYGSVDQLHSVLHAGMEDPNNTYTSSADGSTATELAFWRARTVLRRPLKTHHRVALPFEQVTALHVAAVLGIEDAVVALIDAGAYIDAKS